MNITGLRQTLRRISPASLGVKALSQPRGLTESQTELIPYVEQAKQESLQQRTKIQPLRMLFDLLQRGQYLTANVAKEIISSARSGEPLSQAAADALSGAWRGITGKEKGDWETVLFGGQDVGQAEEFSGLFNEPESWSQPLVKLKTAEGQEQRGLFRPTKLLGFIANVALDPLTYFSFGASKSAQATAGRFADDIVRFGKGKIDDIARAAGYKGGTGSAAEVAQFAKSLRGKGQTMLLKQFNDTIKEATEYALRNPPDVLAQRMMSEMGQRAAMAPGQPIPDLMKMTQQQLQQRYLGGGERAMRILQTEFGKGIRQPWVGERAWETLKKTIGKTPVPGAGTLENAWWQMMNSKYSPVGQIKKMFGIRNPYEQMLNIQHKRLVDFEYEARVADVDQLTEVLFLGFDEKLQQNFVDITARAKAAGMPVSDALNNPALLQQWGMTLGTPQQKKLQDFWDTYGKIVDMWRQETAPWEAENLIKKYGTLNEYFAITHEASGGPALAGVRGAYRPSFTRKQTTGLEGHIDEAMKRLDAMWGVDLQKIAAEQGVPYDAFLRDSALSGGMTDITMDLKEMFRKRAMAQARVAKRANMVTQFKEFGITDDLVKQAVSDPQAIGLKQIQDPSLEGYWFDEEVAGILGKVLFINNPEGKNLFVRAAQAYTNWWKGIVTMTTGFHMRNMFSNEMTGFLKHGPKWFDMRKYTEPVSAGILYALYPQSYMDIVTGVLKKPKGWMDRQLAKRYGDFSIKELADYARQNGIISLRTMAFDPQAQKGVATGLQKANLLSPKFIGFQKSRELGNVIENAPRFKSFLIDFGDISGREGLGTMGTLAERVVENKTALEWAGFEAKKWFIDYGDLSDFEKNVMKTVIPFYCVPVDCEILTQEGWKTYDQLRKGELVMAYDAKSKTGFWHSLKDVAVFDYNGWLMSIRKFGKTLLFTPDHKWPTISGKMKRGMDLAFTDSIPAYPKSFEWIEISELTERQAALAGWLLTDGYMRTRGGHVEYMIYQKKQPFLDEIRKLIGEHSESVHPDTGTICLRFNGTDLKPFLSDKENPFSLLPKLSEKTAHILWNAMYKGDGTVIKPRRDRSTNTSEFLAAQNPKIRDFFQALTILLGKSAGAGPRGVYIGKRHVKVCKMGLEWYTGKIWCPELNDNCWLLRRGGKAVLSGNTWIRKNIANQLSMVTLYPDMYALLAKGTEAATKEGFPEEFQPEWMEQLGMFPVSQEPDTGMWSMFRPDFPYKDINLIPLVWGEEGGVPRLGDRQEIVADIMQSAHPMIKTIVETAPARGWNFFKRREIKKEEPAPALFQYLANSPKVLQFLDGMLRAVGREGIRADLSRDANKVVMDGKLVQILENNFPALRTIATILEGAEETLKRAGIEDIEDWLEQRTGKKDYYTDLEDILNFMSTWFGVKFKGLDIQQQKEIVGEDVIRAAEQAKSDVYKGTAEQRQRSSDYWQRRKELRGKYGLD